MPADGILMSIPGRVAVITGGSRGIGAATVKMFAAAGAKVVFNYQKARAAAEAVSRQCGEERCHAVQADLRDIASARRLIEAAVERFGAVDILVANHGIWPPDDVPVDQMTDEQWHNSIAINLDSVFG